MDPQEDNMQLPAVQSTSDDATDTSQSGDDDSANLSFQSAVNPSSSTAPTVDGTVTPPLAEDVDLIEKEWVEKAKDIVQNTMGDPHTQSDAINKMKADYIKKRYNKDIRSEE